MALMKKDNIRFASLWSKTNTKIARKRGKSDLESVGMQPIGKKMLFQKAAAKNPSRYSKRK